MGTYHAEYGINNQDIGFTVITGQECPSRVSVVLDGCSGASHPEIGAGVFAKLFSRNVYFMRSAGFNGVIETAIGTFKETMKRLSIASIDDLQDYMLFTIVILVEYGTCWYVATCGDGCTVIEHLDGSIEIVPVNHSSKPPYLAYRYLPSFTPYEPFTDDVENTGIDFITTRYGKNEFTSIGIASDGLLAVNDCQDKDRADFTRMLADGNEAGMKRFINKLNYKNKDGGGFFKDDVTIIA